MVCGYSKILWINLEYTCYVKKLDIEKAINEKTDLSYYMYNMTIEFRVEIGNDCNLYKDVINNTIDI